MSLTSEDLSAIGKLMDQKLEPVQASLVALDTNVAALDTKITALDYRVAELDVRLTREIRVVGLDVRDLSERVKRLNTAFASHAGDEPDSIWQHPKLRTKAA